MRRGILAAFVAAAALFSLSSATADQPARFMSVRGDDVEGRQGPSADQRIAWLYQRAGLPVMVLAERDGWTQVRDPDGDEVWMRSEDLEMRRTVYVREQATLRRSARSGGQVVAYLMPGVIGAALLVFTLSMDEFMITYFVSGQKGTLTMYIWSLLKDGIAPRVNALATVLLAASFALLLLGAWVRDRGAGTKPAGERS